MKEDLHMNFYDAQCLGKTAYQSKAKALDRISYQKRNKGRGNGNRRGSLLKPYQCGFCKMWHVGSGANMRDTRYV